jgi:hypothetical protein
VDLIDTVQRHGWVALAIPDGEPAPFAYTIGLWHNYGSPEVAVFGLDPLNMAQILNDIGKQIAGGKPAVASDGIRPVRRAWYPKYFGAALGYYRESAPAVPFLQLLWPDGHGSFPGQAGCAEGCRDGQPWLWVSPGDHHPSPWAPQARPDRRVVEGRLLNELIPALPTVQTEIRRPREG